MELHNYDNQQRRFRHTDADPGRGVALVDEILGFDPPSRPSYDLSYYSGDIGKIDALAIYLELAPSDWRDQLDGSDLAPALKAVEDPSWKDDFLWLIARGELYDDISVAAVDFINANKQDFQPGATEYTTLLFQRGSQVNDWRAFWQQGQQLSFLAYSQG